MNEELPKEIHGAVRWNLSLLLFLGIGLWNLPSLWYPFEPAQALAQVIAKVILEGGVPYRDALDVKPPAIFYLQAGLMALAGDHMHWLRVADLFSLWVTMVLMLRVGSEIRGPACGIWGALLFGLAYPLMGFWKTAQGESFLLPWLWWSLLLAVRGGGNVGIGKSLQCGTALGVVWWFKYPYAIPFPFLVLGRLFQAWGRGSRGGRSPWGPISLAIGFVGVVGGGGLYLWGIGALGDLWQITVVQNVGERADLVASGTFLRRSALFWASLAEFPLFVLILALALVGSFFLIKERPRGAWVVLAYLLGMIAAVELQMRLYHYHVIPLLSVGCLVAGVGLERLIRSTSRVRILESARARWAITGAALVLVITTGLVNHQETYRRWWAYVGKGLSWEAYLATFPDLSGRYRPFVWEEWEVGQALRAMEPKERTLLIWGGFTPLVYYFSGLRPSTPFLYTNFLTVEGPWGEGWMRRLTDSVSARPPGVVVLLKSGDLGDTLRDLQGSVPVLYDLLHSSYSLEAKLGPFLIYQRLAEGERLERPGGP